MKKIFTLIISLVAVLSASAQSENLTSLVADKYDGKVVVSINGASSDPMDANVIIVKNADGTIDFTLKNFILQQDQDIMPVGNIALKNLALTAGEVANTVKFASEQTIDIENGDAEGIEMWLGPLLGSIPVKLEGKASMNVVDIDIDINMVELGQIVHVDFTYGDMLSDGISNINSYNIQNNKVFNTAGQRINANQKGIVIMNGKKIIK